jgi:hypothetical protein
LEEVVQVEVHREAEEGWSGVVDVASLLVAWEEGKVELLEVVEDLEVVLEEMVSPQ